MKIILTDYNSQWPGMFTSEKAILSKALKFARPEIKHVGSTSVPNLCAKPIIDIMIGLNDFGVADSLVPIIQSLGYAYFPQYEDIMPYRRFFKKTGANEVATHHIHMVQVNSGFWNRHLQFRDYLRLHPDIATQYGQLKEELARQDWPHSNDYADAKTRFIRGIEKKADDFFNKGVT